MPYQIEWKPQGVYWTYTGHVTGEDILESNFEIYGDARFDDLRYEIVNLLEAETISVSERHMQKIAFLDVAASRSNTKIRVAVVAREAEAVQLQELYSKYSHGHTWPVRMFHSIEAAESWIHNKTLS